MFALEPPQKLLIILGITWGVGNLLSQLASLQQEPAGSPFRCLHCGVVNQNHPGSIRDMVGLHLAVLLSGRLEGAGCNGFLMFNCEQTISINPIHDLFKMVVSYLLTYFWLV